MAGQTRREALDAVMSIRMGAIEEGTSFEHLLGLRDYVTAWLAELNAEIDSKVYWEGFSSFPGCAVVSEEGDGGGESEDVASVEGGGGGVSEDEVSAGLGWLNKGPGIEGSESQGGDGEEGREGTDELVPSVEQVVMGGEEDLGMAFDGVGKVDEAEGSGASGEQDLGGSENAALLSEEIPSAPVVAHEVGTIAGAGLEEESYEVVVEVRAPAGESSATVEDVSRGEQEAAVVVGEEMDVRESSGQVNTKVLPEGEWPSGMEPSSSGLGWVSRTPTPVMVAAERVCELAAGRNTSLVEMGRAYRSLVRGQ